MTVSLDGTGKLGRRLQGSAAGATTNLLLDVTGYFVRRSAGATYTAIAPDARARHPERDRPDRQVPRTTRPATSRSPGVGGDPDRRGRRHRQPDRHRAERRPASSSSARRRARTRPPRPSTSLPVTTAANARDRRRSTGPASSTPSTRPRRGATTNLLFDVTGYFLHDTSGRKYFPLAPARVLDTPERDRPDRQVHATTPANFQVAGRSARSRPTRSPSPATSPSPTRRRPATSFLGPTAARTRPPRPSTSRASDSRANGVTVSLERDRQAGRRLQGTSGATTNLLLDVTGYFK